MQFVGKFHCDCETHITSGKFSCELNKYAVYGCPNFKKCNWAVCATCYENSLAKSDYADKFPDDDMVNETRRSFVTENEWSTCSRIAKCLKFCVMLVSLDWFYIKLTFEFARALYVRMRIVNESIAADLKELKKDGDILEDATFAGVYESRDVIAGEDVESLSSEPLPSLPWFNSIRKYRFKAAKSEEQELAEELNIQDKWNRLISEFPSYYRMVITVQDDLFPRHSHEAQCARCKICPIIGKRYVLNSDNEISLCEICNDTSTTTNYLFLKKTESIDVCDVVTDCVEETNKTTEVPRYTRASFCYYWYKLVKGVTVMWSWLIFGQLRSERGRHIWLRVFRNYVMYLRIVFGYWTDKAVRDFNLLARFGELEKERIASTDSHKKSLSSIVSAVNLDESANVKVDRMNLVSSLVSTRVVLLQLVPWLTFVSTLAVDISASPILVFNSKLVELLPPLFMFDATNEAIENLKQIGNDTAPWKVRSMAVYLCV